MRTKLFLLLTITSIAGCTIDNYSVPQLTLAGKIIDSQTGELVPSSGVNAGTVIKLFEGNSAQPLLYNTFPDGSFRNSRVFPATYKVVAEGAFDMTEDTLRQKITHDTQIEIRVTPDSRLSLTLISSTDTTASVKVAYEKTNAQQSMLTLGVVWSGFSYPNATVFPGGNIILDDVSALGLTKGEKTYTITGLSRKTQYYIRAVALTNNAGAYYNYSTQLELPAK